MTKLTLDLHFQNIRKAGKKELLEFHIKGNESSYLERIAVIAKGPVVISIGELSSPAEITHFGADCKKAYIKTKLTGNSIEIGAAFYRYVDTNVKLLIEGAQMSLEDFNEPHEGIKINQNADGTIDIVEGQTSIDDIEIEEDEDDITSEDAIAVVESYWERKAEEDILPFQPTQEELTDEGDVPE